MFLGQRIERLSQLRGGQRLESFDLGRLQARLRVGGGLGQLPVFDRVGGGPLGGALRFAVAGDEGVGEDPLEPCLDDCSGLVLVELLVGLQVGLLDQVLGVGSVARHAERRPEELVHEGHGLVHEASLELGVILG